VDLAAAAQAIRRILVDYARRRGRLKRGGAGHRRVRLDSVVLSTQRPTLDLLELLPPGQTQDFGLSDIARRWADANPEKAKQLIAASKYGNVSNLPPIVLTTSGGGGDISGILGGVIEEWRRNLGVEVTVRQLEPETFLYGINQEKDQLFESGWIADFPDPQDFLDLLFHTGAQNNIGNYSNSHLDSLLDQAALEHGGYRASPHPAL